MDNAQKTKEEAEGLYETIKKAIMGDPNAPKVEPVFTGKLFFVLYQAFELVNRGTEDTTRNVQLYSQQML